MNDKPAKLEEERQHTDDSLRAERQHSDELLAAKLAEVERKADRNVEQARDEANAATEEARRESDRLARTVATTAAAKRVIEAERARQDEAREEERRLTDDVLRQDREAHVRVLAALRPLSRDATDRNLLIERRRSDVAVDNRDHFLGIASHDLRNLLGGIVFATTSIDPAQAELGARIRRYAAHMDRLIRDLLDVSSIEAGRLSITVKPGLMRDVLAESIEALAPVAARRGIRIENASGSSPMPAIFDHERLVQVVTNLMSNAVKYSPDGGVVTARAEADDEKITVIVDDGGAGIPEGAREAVFERFWKGPSAGPTGTGLGLYISRHIVEAHGGRIWAEAAPGGGARFRFSFPLALSAPHTSH